MINLIRGYAPLPLRGIHPHNKTPNRATPEEATLLSRNTFKAGKERERQQDQDPNNTAQYEKQDKTNTGRHPTAPQSSENPKPDSLNHRIARSDTEALSASYSVMIWSTIGSVRALITCFPSACG